MATNPADPFGDMESDDLGDDALAAAAPVQAGDAPLYRENCGRCGGTGNVMFGTCYACGGRGIREFRTPPEQRAKRAKPTADSRAKYQDRKAREYAGRLQRWGEANPELLAWMEAASERGFAFAMDLKRGIGQYGHLTERQQQAAERCMVQDKERAERFAQERLQAELRSEPVNPVNLEAVEVAFARAKGQGIKWPKLTLEGFQLKPAGENSRNAGSIYVTQGSGDEGLYLGKVMRGSFAPSRDCDDDTKARVLAAMADPMASAIAYGKKFGRCAVCRRELTDEKSIAAGIGPICKERLFGG